MKFSEIEASAWGELRPYLDTCLIPVTGLTGSEQPYEVTEQLERLRDLMDCLEIPFKGRVVTYPSVQYGGAEMAAFINEICRNTKLSGFKYVIVVSADVEWEAGQLEAADVIVTAQYFPDYKESAGAEQIRQAVQLLWQS